jgi:acetate kinase
VNDLILTLNAGSSSIKFALFEVTEGEAALDAKGQVEGIGTAPHFIATSSDQGVLSEGHWEPVAGGEGHAQAFERIWSWVEDRATGREILGVGHRVAHGGATFARPVRIDAEVVGALTRLTPLVPLHQPNSLAGIEAVATKRPDLPQVACFDTSFHLGRERVTEQFGLPYRLFDRGVRRYGFHGLSYEYVIGRLDSLAPDIGAGRVVVAHLGSGCSMTAIHRGKSVDTSMGFSALDGLPMGTRCGAVDPGVLLYLMRQDECNLTELEDLLYRRSGLLGLSGVSSDLRVLHASDDPRAAEAIDFFVYRIGQTLGALTSSLGGLDALVFTAGVGENDVELRRRVCADASWLGVEVEEAANQTGADRISAVGSGVSVWVIPTDEEQMIATHTLRVLASA